MQVKKKSKKYRSRCSISRTLDLIGDKWTLLIIRDALFLGSKSFGEFSSSPEKIASNILTDRLEKLVSFGILDKTPNPCNKLKIDYTLTKSGRELESVLIAMGKWGHTYINGTNDVETQVKNILKEKNI